MGPATKSSGATRKWQLTFVLFLGIFTLFFHQKLTAQSSESPRYQTPSLSSGDENEVVSTFLSGSSSGSDQLLLSSSDPPHTDEDSNSSTKSSYQKVRTDVNVKHSIFEGESKDQIDNSSFDESDSVWTYKCDREHGCIRKLREAGEESVQIDVCWLNCGSHGALWPFPNQEKVKFGSCLIAFKNVDSVTVSKNNVAFSDPTTEAILNEMQTIFLRQLKQMEPKASVNSKQIATSPKVTISLSISANDKTLGLETNEGYSLLVTSGEDVCNRSDSSFSPEEVKVDISAETVFGARHAFETLSQLITFDFNNNCYKIVSEVSINDTPAFPYRGLLIDTARNFIAVPNLKRMIDAMSYNKMNMLHWHLSDSNSFPVYSESVPQMTKYGAYSKTKVYYPQDIKDLVTYALVRGVKIIPELDAPAHAGNGWQWGRLENLGDLAVCVNAQPWRNYCGQPPCGQLNPVNDNTYKILGKLYSDLLNVFDNDLFHMGGDEVYETCWSSDPIVRKSNSSFLKLWGNFQEKAYESLKISNRKQSIRPIIWTSGLLKDPSERNRLDPSTYIIQVWEDSTSGLIQTLLNEKYQIIMSPVDSMYLDMGAGTWLGREHIYDYKNWQVLYDAHISKSGAHAKQILGGEGTLWSEKVNANNMDSRLWPRAAAIAERLWSSPQSRTTSVYSRLNHHNERMIRKGIRAESVQPESCYRIEGHCDDIQSRLKK